jgi:GTP-binding protein HflX
VIEADLILHVRDVSHGDMQAQSRDVEAVLSELGIKPEDGRIIEVWNKIDRLDAAERERLANLARRQPPQHRPMLVSAATGEGIDALIAAIEACIAQSRVTLTVDLDGGDGAGLSWLHRHAEVLDKATTDEGRTTVRVRVDPTKEGLVRSKFGAHIRAEPERRAIREGRA